MKTFGTGDGNRDDFMKPLVIGLNPSPVMPDSPWFHCANTTGALAYLAFDDPQNPKVCASHFDLRNLNDRIVDKEHISRIDPIEAMTRLTTWRSEGSLQGHVVACGVTVGLMVQAFLQAQNVRGVRLRTIPHPSRLWRKGREPDVPQWAKARVVLRTVLKMPALPVIDGYGIENAYNGFASYVAHVCMERLRAEDAAFYASMELGDEDDDDREDDDWEEREISALAQLAEYEADYASDLDDAERLREEGSFYD